MSIVKDNRSSLDYEDAMSDPYRIAEAPHGNDIEKHPNGQADDDLNKLPEKKDEQPLDSQDVAPTEPVPELNPWDIYKSWQFIIVFISISLGFNAAFLGSINSWNGMQVLLPVLLLAAPLLQSITPLNLTDINQGLNLTTVTAGLDLNQMASGVNTTELKSAFDPNTLFWGIAHTDLKEFASGINITAVKDGIDLRGIARGINPSQVAAGLQLRQLATGLNLTNFLPALYNDFPTAINEVKTSLWIYPTFVFAQIASSIIFGRISDYVGRRWIFLFGNLVSFAGFLAGGRAHGATEITGLSTLIGIGTGIQILGPWLAVAELVPVRHRFTVTGICVSLLAPLIMLNTAIFYALATKTGEGWRWAYYINTILSFASFVGLFFAYHPPTYSQLRSTFTKSRPGKHWLGLAFFTIAVSVQAYALGWAKFIWVWSSPQIIGVVTISGAAFVGFLAYEYIFGNDDDAYPAYLVRNTTHVFQMLISGLHSLLWMIAPIVQLLAFLTVTPRFWMQGAWENIWAAGLIAGFVLASVVLARPKFLKWHLVLGSLFGYVFLMILCTLVRPDQYRLTMSFFFLAGLGQGYMTIITYVTGPMTARHRDMGLSVGLLSAYRGLIFAVIRIILLTLYVNQVISKIQRILLPAFGDAGPIPTSIRSLLEGIGAIQSGGSITDFLDLSISQTMIGALSETLINSWDFVVEVAIVYFGIGVVLSVLAPSTDSYLSDSVFVRLGRGRMPPVLEPSSKLSDHERQDIWDADINTH